MGTDAYINFIKRTIISFLAYFLLLTLTTVLWCLIYLFLAKKVWHWWMISTTCILSLIVLLFVVDWILSLIAIIKFKTNEKLFKKNKIDEKEVYIRFWQTRKMLYSVNTLFSQYRKNGQNIDMWADVVFINGKIQETNNETLISNFNKENAEINYKATMSSNKYRRFIRNNIIIILIASLISTLLMASWLLIYFLIWYRKGWNWDAALTYITVICSIVFVYTTVVWITSLIAVIKFKNNEREHEDGKISTCEANKRFAKLRKIVNFVSYFYNIFWWISDENGWPT